VDIVLNKIQYEVVKLLAIISGIVSLIIFEDYSLHIGVSAFILFIMVIRALGIRSKKRHKSFLITLYIVVFFFQLYIYYEINTIPVEIVTDKSIFGHSYEFWSRLLHRMMALGILFIPFYIEKSFTANNDKEFYMPSIEDINVVSFEDIKSKLSSVDNKMKSIGEVRGRLNYGNFKEIVQDLPRHGYRKYVNMGSLTDEYFHDAYASLDDEHVYIVISNTGSAASDVISVFTKKQYNHTSLSFDRNLKTIISYNGGENIYPPGLNREMVEYFNKSEDSSVIVYRIKITKTQKERMIEKVKAINAEGSAYNILGLVTKKSLKPNMMFCSQFVYKMLKYCEIEIFDKEETEIKPTDFIELDYYRKLEYCYEINFHI
jgi:hypothetical protein